MKLSGSKRLIEFAYIYIYLYICIYIYKLIRQLHGSPPGDPAVCDISDWRPLLSEWESENLVAYQQKLLASKHVLFYWTLKKIFFTNTYTRF